MWYSYFFGLQKKYSMRLSMTSPLVVRLDGKSVTRDKSINILDNYKGSFSDILTKCAEYFTTKYEGYAIFGCDEISFIFTNPKAIFKDFSSESENYSNEFISLFSQYFCDYFNTLFKERKIFWHAKCFSIPQGKIVSYIKHRMKVIANVNTTYFLIKNRMYTDNMNLEERIKKCEQIKEYSQIKNIENGTLVYNGKKIILNEFLNGNIVEENNISNNSDDIEFDL